MIYYLAAGANSMSIFRRRKLHLDAREKEIQDIRHDTFKKIDKSNKSTDKLIRLLDKPTDITEMIYEATSGKKRSKS